MWDFEERQVSGRPGKKKKTRKCGPSVARRQKLFVKKETQGKLGRRIEEAEGSADTFCGENR